LVFVRILFVKRAAQYAAADLGTGYDERSDAHVTARRAVMLAQFEAVPTFCDTIARAAIVSIIVAVASPSLR
jgi:hypothetical protein